MRKVIAAINMTLDGFCDHTAVNPDEAIHQHYAELLRGAGSILFGRITYELMKYWQTVLENPTGNPAMDDFAVSIDKVPKIVFSKKLKNTGWESAKLARGALEEELSALKHQSGKDIFLGSPSLVAAATNLCLIDEYQICVHPVIAGSGLPLFKNVSKKASLTLLGTKAFDCGAVILYYQPMQHAYSASGDQEH